MNYAKVREITIDEIPVIDVPGVKDADGRQLRAVADQMVLAAKGIGFFCSRGHGVSRDMLDETYALSQTFFRSPDELRTVSQNAMTIRLDIVRQRVIVDAGLDRDGAARRSGWQTGKTL